MHRRSPPFLWQASMSLPLYPHSPTRSLDHCQRRRPLQPMAITENEPPVSLVKLLEGKALRVINKKILFLVNKVATVD